MHSFDPSRLFLDPEIMTDDELERECLAINRAQEILESDEIPLCVKQMTSEHISEVIKERNKRQDKNKDLQTIRNQVSVSIVQPKRTRNNYSEY